MRRGDLVTVVLKGDYGKPRPALVIQSDFLPGADSVLVCLVTTTLRDAPLYRLNLPAGGETGLREPSQIMVEKIVAVRASLCIELRRHVEAMQTGEEPPTPFVLASRDARTASLRSIATASRRP